MDTENRLVTPLWKWLLPLLLVVAGVMAYSGSFAGVFLLDDYPAIVWNKHIRHFFPFSFNERCLTDLTYKFTYAVGGLNVAYYHAVNLVIHILAGLLLFGVVRRTFLLPCLAARYAQAAPWLALITAAVWIVHPLQTESVTYICQRYECLMGLFCLLVLYCFIRGVEPASSRPRFWVDMAIASSLLGMLTKESMAVTPILLILYDHIFIADSPGDILRRWQIHAAMICTLGVLFLMVTLSGYAKISAGGILVTQSSPWIYLLTQSEVICHYIRLAFYPLPLCLDYSWPPVAGITSVILPGSLIAGLLIVSGWALWRRAGSGFPLAWFFLTLAPTSSFIPFGDKAFEHRMYLPLAGIVVLCVALSYLSLQAVCRFMGRNVRYCHIAGGLTAAAVICLSGASTINRNLTYLSAEAMWRDVVAQRPLNIRALYGLSNELMNLGKYDEAEQISRRLLVRLDLDSRSGPDAYQMPRSMASHFQSIALVNIGFAFLYSDRIDDSIRHFREAVSICPDDSAVRHNLGLVLLLSGNTNQALFELESVLAAAPAREKTHALVALILAGKSDFSGAVTHLRRAVAIDPSYTSAKCELAWLLATSPDDNVRNGAEALALALDVAESTRYASYRALDVLAAARAETGDFDAARELALRALAIAGKRKELQDGDDLSLWPRVKADDMSMDLQHLVDRVNLYTQKKACRAGRQGVN